MRFSDILQIPKGITAVVGGGGKTSLIWQLATELSAQHKVLVSTTTHIMPPNCKTIVNPKREDIHQAFRHTNLLAAGDAAAQGKLACPVALAKNWAELADYVLIEADGSRGLPLKAPLAYEPVLPKQTDMVIALAGISGMGRTIAQTAHRPQQYARLVNQPQEVLITAEMVAQVLCHPEGQRKSVTGQFAVVLNQVDTAKQLEFARSIAQRLVTVDVLLTALQMRPGWGEHWRCGELLNNGNIHGGINIEDE